MRVVVDALGGDFAPNSTVAGALQAADDGFPILLVGDEGVLADEIAARGGLPPNVTVHHADEWVEMEDAPREALRGKKDSSLRVCFDLLRNGQADALVTMGNSGAALAMGMFVAGRLPGVLRPALAALVPGPQRSSVLLDVGANTECRAEHLVQFGAMGAALAGVAFGVDEPRVAVLSNGEEDGKGTELTRTAAAGLADLPGTAFVGNVEPRQFLDGAAHVVVTDGWTGNILLKTAEAVAGHVVEQVRQAAASDLRAKAGAALLRPSLRQHLAHLDHRELGGGLLLGVDALVVVGHGRSDGGAVAAAIRFAERLARQGLMERLRDTVDVVPAEQRA
jgi:glycerol-3-phosphate acyltransferase PlsX